MTNLRSFQTYREDSMESIFGRLAETAQRLGVTQEELVVQAFTQNGKPVPQKTANCFTIEELESDWPYIPMHVRNCDFCQRLVLSAFPGVLAELGSKLIDEASEVWVNFHGKCLACRSARWFGKQRFYPLPLRKDLNHVQECLFCQFLIHYHRDGKRGRLGLDCLDMDGWRIYPLFHPNDLHNITEHVIKTCHCVIGDEKCSGRAVLRFQFNALRDRPLFQLLKRQSAAQLKWQALVNRFVKKPIGDVISYYRFSRDMFTKKHPWPIWKNEDGLLRLLTADNLSLEERLYKELLENPEREQEIVGRLVATFLGYKPWSWEYKLPDQPLLWNRLTIIDFLRLENKSRQRGISIEEQKVIERAEDKKMMEEIIAKHEEEEKTRRLEI